MKKLAPQTATAIEAFTKAERKSHQQERADKELLLAISAMPEEDLQDYVRITEEIRHDITRKCRTCNNT